ncbi:MAG: thiamine ABC transporter substrate-binding protein [Acidimicrobiia bacterium]|nr:thiamine ABC transporter substrate-binding protein [Acidimicrobiia bacterium]
MRVMPPQGSSSAPIRNNREHYMKTILLILVIILVSCGSGDEATSTTIADQGTGQATTETEGSVTTVGSASPTAATSTTTGGGESDLTLTLIAHDSFADAAGEVFAPFTEETGISVEILAGGDAGSLTNQLVLTADNPIADVMFGIDDTFLTRALDEEILLPYESPLLSDVPDELELDEERRATPIDYGDVCFNYDIAALEEAGVEPPTDLEQLTQEPYQDLVVVESAATSSPGLAFLLATIAEFGEDGWQEYWQGLVDNGVEVAADWDAAYYSSFTRYGGERPIVMSYASSPPAEVIFAEEPLETAPTAVVTNGCYRQIEFAGILAGTDHEAEAGKLIDFMLSPGFQKEIPLTWFVFPANETVELPQEFVEFTDVPDSPARIPIEEIAANRELWIREWNAIVDG